MKVVKAITLGRTGLVSFCDLWADTYPDNELPVGTEVVFTENFGGQESINVIRGDRSGSVGSYTMGYDSQPDGKEEADRERFTMLCNFDMNYRGRNNNDESFSRPSLRTIADIFDGAVQFFIRKKQGI